MTFSCHSNDCGASIFICVYVPKFLPFLYLSVCKIQVLGAKGRIWRGNTSLEPEHVQNVGVVLLTVAPLAKLQRVPNPGAPCRSQQHMRRLPMGQKEVAHQGACNTITSEGVVAMRVPGCTPTTSPGTAGRLQQLQACMVAVRWWCPCMWLHQQRHQGLRVARGRGCPRGRASSW